MQGWVGWGCTSPHLPKINPAYAPGKLLSFKLVARRTRENLAMEYAWKKAQLHRFWRTNSLVMQLSFTYRKHPISPTIISTTAFFKLVHKQYQRRCTSSMNEIATNSRFSWKKGSKLSAQPVIFPLNQERYEDVFNSIQFNSSFIFPIHSNTRLYIK